MSEMSDRMKELDEQYKKTISLAMDRDRQGGPDIPGQEPPSDPAPQKGKDFSLSMVALYILCGLTIAIVVIYSSMNAVKVSKVERAGDQLEILLEEQTDEFQEFKRHVEAMELEFRRAFKKDREGMAAIRAELIGNENALSDKIEKLADEIRNDVLKYKSAVADNESRTGQISREYNNLMSKFNQVQEEFKQLRARVMNLTAPQMPE